MSGNLPKNQRILSLRISGLASRMGQMKLFSSFYISDVLYDLDLGGSKVGLGGRESPAMSITSTSTFFEKNADATTLLPIIQAQRERSSSSQVFTIPECTNFFTKFSLLCFSTR